MMAWLGKRLLVGVLIPFAWRRRHHAGRFAGYLRERWDVLRRR